jgi:hypothetical protein
LSYSRCYYHLLPSFNVEYCIEIKLNAFISKQNGFVDDYKEYGAVYSGAHLPEFRDKHCYPTA